jgi:hypothetical protein
MRLDSLVHIDIAIASPKSMQVAPRQCPNIDTQRIYYTAIVVARHAPQAQPKRVCITSRVWFEVITHLDVPNATSHDTANRLKVMAGCVRAEPDDDLLGSRVYVAHSLNWVDPLRDIALVDAECVYPEGSLGVFSSRGDVEIEESCSTRNGCLLMNIVCLAVISSQVYDRRVLDHQQWTSRIVGSPSTTWIAPSPSE